MTYGVSRDIANGFISVVNQEEEDFLNELVDKRLIMEGNMERSFLNKKINMINIIVNLCYMIEHGKK